MVNHELLRVKYPWRGVVQTTSSSEPRRSVNPCLRSHRSIVYSISSIQVVMKNTVKEYSTPVTPYIELSRWSRTKEHAVPYALTYTAGGNTLLAGRSNTVNTTVPRSCVVALCCAQLTCNPLSAIWPFYFLLFELLALLVRRRHWRHRHWRHWRHRVGVIVLASSALAFLLACLVHCYFLEVVDTPSTTSSSSSSCRTTCGRQHHTTSS